MAEIDYSQVTGLVHSTESFGSVDGPGIRFIVFMQRILQPCMKTIKRIPGPSTDPKLSVE